ncbi:ABC transporter permease [Paenibacillaceae bacterium]|nr:ABC transporter permease [Paenibacillaceae bacterium]
MRLIWTELYKILAQKVIYIAFLLFVLFYSASFFSQSATRSETRELQSYYETYGGKLTAEKLQWAEQIDAEFQAERKARNEAAEQEQREQKEQQGRQEQQSPSEAASPAKEQAASHDTLSPEDYNNLLLQYRVASAILNLHSNGLNLRESYARSEAERAEAEGSLYRQAEAKKMLASFNKVGTPDYAMNQEVWNSMLRYLNEVGYLFAAALTILGVSSVFSREYNVRMDSLIFSSRHGRARMTWAKVAAVVLYCTMVVLAFAAVVLLLNGWYYGFSGWDKKLINLHNLYNHTAFTGSISLYFIMQQLYAIAGCIALGLLVMLCSSRTRSPLIPAFICGTIMMLPMLIILLNLSDSFIFELVFRLFRYMEFIELSMLGDNFYLNYFGTPVLYRYGIIPILALYYVIPVVLLHWSIRRREVA